MRNTILAVDLPGENGHVRKMDKEKHRELMTRYSALKKEMKQRGEIVAKQYAEAKPYLTSRAFWEKYLGL